MPLCYVDSYFLKGSKATKNCYDIKTSFLYKRFLIKENENYHKAF